MSDDSEQVPQARVANQPRSWRWLLWVLFIAGVVAAAFLALVVFAIQHAGD